MKVTIKYKGMETDHEINSYDEFVTLVKENNFDSVEGEKGNFVLRDLTGYFTFYSLHFSNIKNGWSVTELLPWIKKHFGHEGIN